MNKHVPLQFSIVKELFTTAVMGTLELYDRDRYAGYQDLTSLSPCTVRCFFRDALSLKILPQDSRWHEKVLYWWWFYLLLERIAVPIPLDYAPFKPDVPFGSLREPCVRDEVPPFYLRDGFSAPPRPLALFLRILFLLKCLEWWYRDPNIPPPRTIFKFKLTLNIGPGRRNYYTRLTVHLRWRVLPPKKA